MSFANKTFLAAILFLAIQFMSMVGGVQFIATMQNYAVIEVASDLPHEGMSLEHVVPLDPFLGGAGLGTDLARFGFQANLICALVFSLLVILALKAPRNRFELSPVINRRTSRLWLSKRSLLI